MKKNIIYVDFIFRKKKLKNKFDFFIYKINIFLQNYISNKKLSKNNKQIHKTSFFKKVL